MQYLSRPPCSRVARIAERRQRYVCDVHLREGLRATPAACYRNRRRRGHSSIAGLEREKCVTLEVEGFDNARLNDQLETFSVAGMLGLNPTVHRRQPSTGSRELPRHFLCRFAQDCFKDGHL